MEWGRGGGAAACSLQAWECGYDQAMARILEERYFRTDRNQMKHVVGTVEGKKKEIKENTHARTHIHTHYMYTHIIHMQKGTATQSFVAHGVGGSPRQGVRADLQLASLWHLASRFHCESLGTATDRLGTA